MPLPSRMAWRMVTRGHGGAQVDLVAAEAGACRLPTAAAAAPTSSSTMGHDVVVVDVGLVGLEHGELGVVLEAHALVAEVAADLVDAVDAADDAALEVELDGDAQVEVALELVVVGDEGPRHGAAVERLQDGRLDLDEAALVEEAADGGDDAGALDEDLARIVVDDGVEVALAVARLDVGQAVELLGQRAQRLGEELPGGGPQRKLAAPRLAARYPRRRRSRRCRRSSRPLVAPRRPGRRAVAKSCRCAGAVLDREKGELAVLAARHDAAGHAEGAGRLGAGFERVEALVQRADLVATARSAWERPRRRARAGARACRAARAEASSAAPSGWPSSAMTGPWPYARSMSMILRLASRRAARAPDDLAGLVAHDGAADRRLVGELVRRLGSASADPTIEYCTTSPRFDVLEGDLGAHAHDVGLDVALVDHDAPSAASLRGRRCAARAWPARSWRRRIRSSR